MNTIKTILTSYCLVLLVQPATALTISDGPLFLSVSIPPNVIMTLDDSGSMAWAYSPDSIADDSGEIYFKSSTYNSMHYNPEIDYIIPTRQDGIKYATSFTSARFNGFNADRGSLDLSNEYRAIKEQTNINTTNCSYCFIGGAEAAHYYAFTPNNNCKIDNETNLKNKSCYKKIIVGSANDTTKRTSEKNKENFAIWYSFYKARSLAAMSAAMRTIDDISDQSIRFGWQTLNECTTFGSSCKDNDDKYFTNRLMTLTQSHRTNFYNWLQNATFNSGTPLRSALERAGEYYRTKGKDSPYAETPYNNQGTEYSCRKNFHLMFTDGVWNSDNPSGGNLDNQNQTFPIEKGKTTSRTYTPRAPYKDDNSTSLADLAFKYWYSDLRSDLDNNITPNNPDKTGSEEIQYWNPKNSVSTWQNMVNYTVGFGLGRSLKEAGLKWDGDTFSGSYPSIAADSTAWPSTATENSGRVTDLWHAAINSRGRFFSADDPESLVMAFKSALDAIINSTPSSAALAANSTSLNTGSLIFQASLDSNLWSGKLLARQPQADGTIGSALWDASQLMPAPGERNIVIKKTSGAVAFKNCSDLDSNQQTALGKSGSDISACTNRINWLRGDDSKEVRKTGGVYRNRASAVTDKANPLGDIVNSDPVFTHAEDLGYGYKSGFSEAEKSGYANFLLTKKSAPPFVLVGANDGMLHAFRADTGNTDSGKELFAFIPYAVSTSLHKLTDPAYSHQYFVDGTVSVGDAYLNSTWKRVAIGGLGKGGKSVYALDISTPASFTASNVLWEYTESDMGYSFSQPQIARLNNGQWAAIFGNGYADNSNGKAILYIVNLSNGTLIKKIMTDTTTDNGLSTPVLYDKNKDGITDAVYAGDLKGRLWYFDLSNDDTSQWDVGIKSGNQAQPLFQAKNASNETQPITVKPFAQSHPSGGIILLFGTGQYLSSTDVSNKQLQSFYGIWHKPGKLDTLERANLQQQSITSEVQKFGFGLRETTANIVDWNSKSGWYMDLAFPANSPKGERVVFDAITKNGLVAFTTITPSSDPCTPGGMTWFMELQATTGGRTKVSPFDLNNDGKFDENDNLDSKFPANGISLPLGIAKPPVWLGNGPHYLKLFTGTNGGTTMIRNNKPGMTRMYWQQIL